MTEATWGVRFNEYSNYERSSMGQKPAGCPEWLEGHQLHIWQKQGLVIWNSIDRKIEAFSGIETLKLLNELSAQDYLKSNGITVTRLVHRIDMSQPTRKRRKKGEPEPEIEKPKGEDVYEEIIHLPPEAGYELIQFLESKKQIISQMAEQEKKQFDEAMRRFWDDLFEFSHEKEMREFDFSGRSFEWSSDGASRMICRFQAAEGRIWLDKDHHFFWNVCVKREGHAGKLHHFVKFADGVDWVEKEIVELANEPEVKKTEQILSKEEIRANRIRLKEKLIHGPYWIDPARLEPQQVTYKVLIDLESKPVSYKKFETICGDTYEYADRYPASGKLATDVNLDVNRFEIDQPVGENSGFYRFTSLTTYYREASALEQAQKDWNQSRVLQRFKTGEIIRGQFGCQEVETGFLVLLGACGETGQAWHEEQNRNDFMERKSLRESLCYALDVNDYRDFLGMSVEIISDEHLLELMHEARSNSKFIPDETRKESRVWLAQHKPLE